MVERDHSDLSIVRQCRLLSISRSSFYAAPRGESDANLAIMAEIDRQFLDTPFYGVRQMTWHLRSKGWQINVKRVRRLMRKMGLMPIYQRPRTSTPAPGHKIDPYLLRDMVIDRPNQVPLSPKALLSSAGQGVHRHHVCPLGSRLSVPRRDHGLVEPQGSGLAAVQHHGGRVLRRRARGGPGSLRQARDLQVPVCSRSAAKIRSVKPDLRPSRPAGGEIRPGEPVHLNRLYPDAEGERRAHLDGRQRSRSAGAKRRRAGMTGPTFGL